MNMLSRRYLDNENATELIRKLVRLGRHQVPSFCDLLRNRHTTFLNERTRNCSRQLIFTGLKYRVRSEEFRLIPNDGGISLPSWPPVEHRTRNAHPSPSHWNQRRSDDHIRRCNSQSMNHSLLSVMKTASPPRLKLKHRKFGASTCTAQMIQVLLNFPLPNWSAISMRSICRRELPHTRT